jgi:hypothetical protein
MDDIIHNVLSHYIMSVYSFMRSAISGAHVIQRLQCVIRRTDPKSETQMMKHMRKSKQHTATSHMNSSLTLVGVVAKFFRTTPASETYLNHVKLTLFDVKDCAPILAEDHPVSADMTKPKKGVCSVLRKLSPNVKKIKTPILHLAQLECARPSSVVIQHYDFDSFLSGRTLHKVHRKSSCSLRRPYHSNASPLMSKSVVRLKFR